MKLYLAGPMTGLPDNNFPAFHAAAAALRGLGLEVVNPAELNAGHPVELWRDCMRRDIRELVTCDGIYLLPNWTMSRGARLEFHIASQLNLWIFNESSTPSKSIPKNSLSELIDIGTCGLEMGVAP